MAKLQGAEHNKKGRGLEYLYLSVHDEDRDGEFNSLLLLCVSFLSLNTYVFFFVFFLSLCRLNSL